jgi:hypothetical protein
MDKSKRNAQSRQNEGRSNRSKLSLHPLSVDDALRGAMATGKPPEPVPQNKHAKRTATKRRLTKGGRAVKRVDDSVK